MYTVYHALKLAVDTYGLRTDKSGRELMVYHSIRVAMGLVDPIDHVIALLHDIIEDSDLTAGDLLQLGVPSEAVEVIVELTRTDEQYYEYINNIRSWRGIRIKLHDIEDNMSRLHILPDTKEQQSMALRYKKAYNILMEKARALYIEDVLEEL